VPSRFAKRRINGIFPQRGCALNDYPLGFGMHGPATLIGEIIVSGEVILGWTTVGLFLSVLAQNIARCS
jgi:hypothetical protein